MVCKGLRINGTILNKLNKRILYVSKLQNHVFSNIQNDFTMITNVALNEFTVNSVITQ